AKLKKDSALKNVPLIITSAEATPETFEHHKKLKTRAEEYLKKPFSPNDLVKVLRGYVQFQSNGSFRAEEAPIAEELSIEDQPPQTLSDDEVFSADESSSMTARGHDSMSQFDEVLSDLQKPGTGGRGRQPQAAQEFQEEDDIMTSVGFAPPQAMKDD